MGVKTLGHVHLRGTDHHASVTLEEVVEAARRFGFTRIDLTLHLRDPSNPHQPPAITFDWLGERWETAPKATESGGPKVQLGLEVNIIPIYSEETVLEVGLDLEPNTPLAGPMIASYHFTDRTKLGWPKDRDSETCSQQDPGWMLRGYLEILGGYQAPLDVSVLGHPFEYASKPPTVGQVQVLARVSEIEKVALEVNLRRLLKVADPSENILQQKVLLLRQPYVDVLAQTGVGLYLGTDIHHSNELENLGNIQCVAEYLLNNRVQKEQIVGWED